MRLGEHKPGLTVLGCGLVCAAAMLAASCGSPPGSPPGLPPPVEWTGGIRIWGWIETATDSMLVDSVGVVLDGDDIGYRPNPCLIDELAEGVYAVSTYARFENATYVAPVQTVLVSHGTTSEVRARMTRADLRGWLAVVARAEGIEIDSFRLRIDNVDYGVGGNPRLIGEVPEGEHKVACASYRGDDLWEGFRYDVIVVAGDTAQAVVEVSSAAPLEGSHAPDLYCVDLGGEPHALSDHWGEVIYLYFFEHT